MKALALFLALVAIGSARPLPDCPQTFHSEATITDSMIPWPLTGNYLYFDFPRGMMRQDYPGMGGKNIQIDDYNQNLSYVIKVPDRGQPTCRACFQDDKVFPMMVPFFSSFLREENLRGVQCEVWHAYFGFQPFQLELTYWVKTTAPQVIMRFQEEDEIAGPHRFIMDLDNHVVGPIPPAIWNPNTTCSEPQCKVPLELMLLIDGSGSISGSDFSLMKQFAAKITKSFTVSNEDVHIGVVQFASNALTHIGLSGNAGNVISAINGMSQIGSSTNMDIGLKTCRDIIVNQGRQGVTSIVIMFTDGAPDYGTDPVGVAAQLKNRGIHIYTVGVGSGVNPTLLKQIASAPPETHAFLASSFAELQRLLTQLVKNACIGNRCLEE